MKYELFHGDCLEVLPRLPVPGLNRAKCLFADPPDNIGLGYGEYKDKMPDAVYEALLERWLTNFVERADIVWFSFNAKWTAPVGSICNMLVKKHGLEFKPCVQVFTFGQHNKRDLGNNHRPLYRLRRKDAVLYPDQIKVPSWRQRNGDKRAAKDGRVPGDVFDMQYPQQQSYGTDTPGRMARSPKSIPSPMYVTGSTPFVPPPPTPNRQVANGIAQALQEQLSRRPPNIDADIPLVAAKGGDSGSDEVWPGDVFDFPRVTGNSKQRCDWHPTQLHEELVARCVLLSTTPTDRVISPFGGTGTDIRVCKKLGRPCTMTEFDLDYCHKIAEANGLKASLKFGGWQFSSN
jgi:DNA modification methylase